MYLKNILSFDAIILQLWELVKLDLNLMAAWRNADRRNCCWKYSVYFISISVIGKQVIPVTCEQEQIDITIGISFRKS